MLRVQFTLEGTADEFVAWLKRETREWPLIPIDLFLRLRMLGDGATAVFEPLRVSDDGLHVVIEWGLTWPTESIASVSPAQYGEWAAWHFILGPEGRRSERLRVELWEIPLMLPGEPAALYEAARRVWQLGRQRRRALWAALKRDWPEVVRPAPVLPSMCSGAIDGSHERATDESFRGTPGPNGAAPVPEHMPKRKSTEERWAIQYPIIRRLYERMGGDLKLTCRELVKEQYSALARDPRTVKKIINYGKKQEELQRLNGPNLPETAESCR